EAGHRTEAFEGRRIKAARDIDHRTARQTPGVRMRIGPAVVARGTITVRQLRGESTPDERLQGFVDRRQGDVREVNANRGEDIVRGRMLVRTEKIAVHSSALLRETLAVRLERFAKPRLTFGWIKRPRTRRMSRDRHPALLAKPGSRAGQG